jgi:hypothetical protein
LSLIKVIKIEELNEKTEELLVVRDKISEVLRFGCTSLEERILHKYIVLQNAANVTEHLNNEGYRIKSNGRLSERKFNSNDISDIIVNSAADNDLCKIAKVPYKFNTGRVAWIMFIGCVKVCSLSYLLYSWTYLGTVKLI